MNNQSRPKDATHFEKGHLKYGVHGLIMKHNGDEWVNWGKGTLQPSQSLEALEAKRDKDLRSYETLTIYGD